MSKHNQVDLLFYCLDYPKRLSLDFIRAFCGFPTICALTSFAREYGISMERSNMKVIPICQAPSLGSSRDYYRYKDEQTKEEMLLETKAKHYKLLKITKDLTT
tara:strand:+ start:33 stop:341 length:309 start_codon:yes stop_codon:yes gene_type:complete